MRSDMPVRRRVRERILASGERSPARSPRGRAARGCLLLVALLAFAWLCRGRRKPFRFVACGDDETTLPARFGAASGDACCDPDYAVVAVW